MAVVGSGPAGLAVAEQLALRGHGVKVFEAWPRPGGILRYGIPGFKMDKRHVDDQVEHLRRLGVQFVFNVRVGYDVTVDALFAEGFDAVFLGHGAGQGNRLNVPGEELAGHPHGDGVPGPPATCRRRSCRTTCGSRWTPASGWW